MLFARYSSKNEINFQYLSYNILLDHMLTYPIIFIFARQPYIPYFEI